MATETDTDDTPDRTAGYQMALFLVDAVVVAVGVLLIFTVLFGDNESIAPVMLFCIGVGVLWRLFVRLRQ